MISEIDVKDFERVDVEPVIKEYKISTLQDIYNLSSEQFERFIPDLRSMHDLGKKLISIEDNVYKMTDFIWVDDFIEGISGVRFSDGVETKF